MCKQQWSSSLHAEMSKITTDAAATVAFVFNLFSISHPPVVVVVVIIVDWHRFLPGTPRLRARNGHGNLFSRRDSRSGPTACSATS